MSERRRGAVGVRGEVKVVWEYEWGWERRKEGEKWRRLMDICNESTINGRNERIVGSGGEEMRR